MFGLEDQKKKKNEDFVFELETKLRSLTGQNALKKQIEVSISRVKNNLRNGENKEEFDQFGILLHGYTSLLKVISRFKSK